MGNNRFQVPHLCKNRHIGSFSVTLTLSQHTAAAEVKAVGAVSKSGKKSGVLLNRILPCHKAVTYDRNRQAAAIVTEFCSTDRQTVSLALKGIDRTGFNSLFKSIHYAHVNSFQISNRHCSTVIQIYLSLNKLFVFLPSDELNFVSLTNRD